MAEDYSGTGGTYDQGTDHNYYVISASTNVPTSSRARKSSAAGAGKRPSQDHVIQGWKDAAQDFLRAFQAAEAADDASVAAGQPPLARIGLIPQLKLVSNRVAIHEFLLQNRILNVYASCLADLKRKQLSPFDLRTAALDCLELFAVEGVICGRLPVSKKKNGGGGGDVIEDDISYFGMTVEQLKDCPELGRALALVRKSPEETTDNRRRASTLLENYSRAFHGVFDPAAPGTDSKLSKKRSRNGVVWRARGDDTVLPPFEVLKLDAERYLGKFARVDPLDPSSYNRVPEKRNPPAYVTALYLNDEKKRTDDDE